MSDLISRQAVFDALIEKGQNSKRYKLGENWELNLPEIIEAINAIPSAEPERTANVIRHRYEFTVKDNFFHAFGGTELLCENCKKKVLAGDDYCSHCGSKLIWGDENDK